MKAVLKWGLIGCGALSLIGIGLIVLVIAVGVAGSSSGSSTPKISAAPTSTAVVARSGAQATPQPAAPAPKPAEKPATVARVGERIESGGMALTVLSTRRTESAGQFMKAKPGRTFLIADVTIESVSRDALPYNPFYFKVKDADGREYTSASFGNDNSLKSGELPRGDKVRGDVAFDVPAEVKGLVMSYQPVVIFGGYQTIRVQLD